MSTRYNTGNPIESTDVRDMSDNAKNLDEFSVSTQSTFVDRLGVERKTLTSLISKAEQDIYYALINAGFQPASFDFVTGGTLVSGDRNKAVFNPEPSGDNNWYAWQGAFPKIISPNSTPSTSGGLGDNAWKPVTNNILAPTVMESIRRSYAEAGLKVVAGSFEAGGTVNNKTDVLLFEAEGKAYSYNSTLPHTVVADSSPSAEPGMWVDKSHELLRNQRSKKIGDSVNLAEFPGYDPTGLSVSDDAFIAAIQSLPQGGVIYINNDANLSLSTQLVSNQPVLLKAKVRGDISSNTNGSGSTAARPRIRWTGVPGGYMYTVKPAMTGNVIWGGGSDGIEWDGNALAATAVLLDNTKFAKFDGKVRNVTYAGVVVNSKSGNTTNFSQLNDIDLDFVWGTDPACHNANGLVLEGDNVSVPATQQQLGVVVGLVYNGALVRIAETDNCYAKFISGTVQSGGNGCAVDLKFAGAQPAHHNVFAHVSGEFRQDAGVFGTKLLHFNSEGAGISSIAGDSSWDGDVVDYANGRSFTSHQYQLRKWLTITPGDFIGDAATTQIDAAYQWRTLAFPNSGSAKASAILPPDYDLYNGHIEQLEFIYTTNGTAGGSLKMRFAFSTCAIGSNGPLVTPEHTFDVTIPQAAQYTIAKHIYAVAPAVSLTAGDLMAFFVQRMASDPADTATDEVQLLGVRLNYKSTGPDSSGSGTFYIPAWN